MNVSIDEFSAELNYTNRILHEFSKEDDRAASILVAAELDRMIHAILSKHLLDATGSSSPLLNRDGPLEAFAARIELAYRIGLIPPVYHHDLQIVRKIRNAFAHASSELSFDDPSITRYVRRLLIGKHEVESMPLPSMCEEQKKNFLAAKSIYRITAAILLAQLATLHFQVTPVEQKWKTYFGDGSGINLVKRSGEPHENSTRPSADSSEGESAI